MQPQGTLSCCGKGIGRCSGSVWPMSSPQPPHIQRSTKYPSSATDILSEFCVHIPVTQTQSNNLRYFFYILANLLRCIMLRHKLFKWWLHTPAVFSCWVWSSQIVPSQKLIQEGEGLVLIRKLLRSGGRLETGQFRRMRDFETLVTKIRLRILVIKNGSISFWD